MDANNCAFDDAVAAFHNGEALAKIGYTTERVNTYQVFYIHAMSRSCHSADFRSEMAQMAIDDANMDRAALEITGEA